ncbi:MAG: alpha/beta hydrolase family protein [Planctomycetota bacterium]
MHNEEFGPETYTQHLSEETWREFGCRATDGEELHAWQKEFRHRLMGALGIPEILKRGECGLEPEMEERDELDEGVRELWTIQSEPGFRVPFYLMRPHDQDGPVPLILAPHGHGAGHLTYVGLWRTEEERRKAVEGERDIGFQAIRHGYTAIVPVLRGYHRMALQSWGRRNAGHNTCESQQMLALMFGRTLVGERCHDLSRILDYAETRSDIQSDRVAVTGNSGGGTMSLFAAAVDTRIKVAMPSCYFCTFEASLGSIGHCPCNFVPGIMKLGEMYDVAGLIAPRPFLAISGKDDEIFPIEAAKYAFEKVKTIYGLAEAKNMCKHFIGSEGHRYYKEPVWPFVEKWL